MEETAGATPLLPGLPDEIALWEILVRLPPNSLLRCRAVCRDWRRTLSAGDFLLAHHARQPTLPLLYGDSIVANPLCIIPFDHRAGLQQPVARPGRVNDNFHLDASCDGLLLLSNFEGLSICNPATRQYAHLSMISVSGFKFLGIYRHRPTGEYRMLLYDGRDRVACYVFTLGSGQPPRHIGRPPDELNLIGRPVLFGDRLHWHPMQHHNGTNVIIVFDTAAESFHQMCAAVAPGRAMLFEMDGMLGMSGFDDSATVIDIWTMQDHETEIWAFKCRDEAATRKAWGSTESDGCFL